MCTVAMGVKIRAVCRAGVNLLPVAVRRAIKRVYYTRVARTFTEERWPLAEGVRRWAVAGARVVDVGANVGYITTLLSRWVGSGGRVYSLEPIPETFDVLEQVVLRQGLSNVVAICSAAGAEDGNAQMQVPDYPDGGHNYYESRLVSGAGPDASSGIPVRVARLDTLLLGRDGPFALIKIDAEGHELAVVQGALGLLRRDHPALLIEVEGNPDAPASKAGALFQLLAQEGYAPFIYRPEGFLSRQPGHVEVDYFFLHKAVSNAPAPASNPPGC